MAVQKREVPPSRESAWKRQFSATEPRLSEMIANYEDLGLEVLLVPTSAEADLECKSCLTRDDGCYTIFTRPTVDG